MSCLSRWQNRRLHQSYPHSSRHKFNKYLQRKNTSIRTTKQENLAGRGLETATKPQGRAARDHLNAATPRDSQRRLDPIWNHCPEEDNNVNTTCAIHTGCVPAYWYFCDNQRETCPTFLQ
ncbi:uncharacterized protein LOC118151090 isoform X2 [Callithrix jacchus]